MSKWQRRQVTEWGWINDPVVTVVGTMNYECWLQREVVRFGNKWCEAWLEVNTDAAIAPVGAVALFTWDDGELLPVIGEDAKE